MCTMHYVDSIFLQCDTSHDTKIVLPDTLLSSDTRDTNNYLDYQDVYQISSSNGNDL